MSFYPDNNRGGHTPPTVENMDEVEGSKREECVHVNRSHDYRSHEDVSSSKYGAGTCGVPIVTWQQPVRPGVCDGGSVSRRCADCALSMTSSKSSCTDASSPGTATSSIGTDGGSENYKNSGTQSLTDDADNSETFARQVFASDSEGLLTALKERRISPRCVSHSSSSVTAASRAPLSASTEHHFETPSGEGDSGAELEDVDISRCVSSSRSVMYEREAKHNLSSTQQQFEESEKKDAPIINGKSLGEITAKTSECDDRDKARTGAAASSASGSSAAAAPGKPFEDDEIAPSGVDSSEDAWGAGPSSHFVNHLARQPLSSKRPVPVSYSSMGPPSSTTTMTPRRRRRRRHHYRHLPVGLPTFRDPRAFMWTSTHDANAPSEDRNSSLVNVLLRPPRASIKLKTAVGSARRRSCSGMTSDNISSSGSSGSSYGESGDEETQRRGPEEENASGDNTSLIRLSLWSVVDGHGGGCVATYASEVLLPHIAASVARALKCTIVDRGVCTVNGQLRDANALDFDGLIQSSDRSRYGEGRNEAGIDMVNPNSIHYRSPSEADSESEGEVGVLDQLMMETGSDLRDDGIQSVEQEPPVSVASSLLPRNPPPSSVSSVKTSVKTAVSPVTQHAPVGTHAPAEVAEITRAITESFLAVDEGWINSIDPISTHQTSCISNGRWNAGACALVVFTVQRLDWTRSSLADPETELGDRGACGGDDTSHNKDAARRRKLDYATKSKSVSSLSTISSTSSLTTVAPPTTVSVQESEITETEDDDDVSDIFGPSRRRGRSRNIRDDPHHSEGVVIQAPGGCKCHYYRPHDAMLYTAHVGDCRAVMLGSAPPRTIKVRPEGDSIHRGDFSEDYSSCGSCSDDSDGMSSSDHDSDSSEDEEEEEDLLGGSSSGYHYMSYMRRPAKRQCRRGAAVDAMTSPPYTPLPPLRHVASSSSEESELESDDSSATAALGLQPESGNNWFQSKGRKRAGPEPAPPQLQPEPNYPPPIPLSPLMRPTDLTTDHSAYNPAEVTAVLRRCNNAPRAISSASGGGIKRVAGSLAVTRALGDAYLKTPHLSFFPYKRHAPYITARPEVNCRLLTKGGDRILILASDGVWERVSGEDVLRWVRNYYNERIAGVQNYKRHKRNERDFPQDCRNMQKNHDDVDCSARKSRFLSLPPSSTENGGEKGGRTSGGDRMLSGHKRKRGVSIMSGHSTSASTSSRSSRHHSSSSLCGNNASSVPTVSDVIVRRVLNKVRKARNMPSLRSLMELPRGRARRSKHDDITACVIDMSGFVS